MLNQSRPQISRFVGPPENIIGPDDNTDYLPPLTFFARAVVVGVDPSRHARTALDWSARWASRHGRRLILLGSHHAGDDARTELEEFLDAERTEISCYYPELTVNTVVTGRPPAPALAYASGSASLTVTGTRRRGDVTTFFHDGVPEQLSRLARGPVAVIPPNVDISPGGSVVVGLDDTRGVEDALSFAADEAVTSRLPLVAVHACDHEGPDGVAEPTVAEADVGHSHLADDVAQLTRPPLASRLLRRVRMAYPQLTVVQALDSDAAPQRWEESAMRASMVVVAARTRGKFARLVGGSTSGVVARTVRCAAVIVPERRRLAGA